MSAEDVYGFADPELETLRVQVEAALGLGFAPTAILTGAKSFRILSDDAY